jgi:hypothetical protein
MSKTITTAPVVDNHTAPELITLFIGLSTPDGGDPDSARTTAISLLGERFPSFTVTEGTGFFRGSKEPVLIAQIATTAPREVAEAAEIIRSALHQEGVGIAFRGLYHRATEGHIPELIGEEVPRA